MSKGRISLALLVLSFLVFAQVSVHEFVDWDDGVWITQNAKLSEGLTPGATWRVLAEDGQWPLPRLAEKRNVYWDGASNRLVNGVPMGADQATWLPATLPAASAATPIAHRIDFPNGETIIVRPATAADQPRPAENLRLAVVLDRSRSMARHGDEISAALASETLDDIEHALSRLAAGTYGTCEPCGQVIPLERLEAIPHASTCVTCAVAR